MKQLPPSSFLLFVHLFSACGLLLLGGSTPVVSGSSIVRSITIQNLCPNDYSTSLTSGSAPSTTTGNTCQENSDCSEGSECGGNGICYWTVPVPSSGSFSIPSKSSVTFSFPFYNNSIGTWWSGNFGFCRSGTCGTCSDTSGCGVAGGPVNIAEFTLAKTSVDYYDISNIGGVNVPMSFGPEEGSLFSYSPSEPYNCGTPGAITNPNGEWESSWAFSPPSVYNRWVSTGNVSCTSDAQCSGSDVCGLVNKVGAQNPFQLTCGQLLGFWTAGAVCGSDSSFGSPFNCEMKLGSPNSGLDLDNLYGCTGVGSCYQSGAESSCCGCVNWDAIIGSDLSPSSTQQCNSANPNWIRYVLPQIEWVKMGCPSCYTFPYDDMSSTFVCSQTNSKLNTLNYTVVLCPNGTQLEYASAAALGSWVSFLALF